MSLSWSTVSCKQVWRLSVAGKSAFGWHIWSDLHFRVKPRAIKHQALVINDNPEFLMAHDSNRPGLKPSKEQKLHNFVVPNGVHREYTPKLQWDCSILFQRCRSMTDTKRMMVSCTSRTAPRTPWAERPGRSTCDSAGWPHVGGGQTVDMYKKPLACLVPARPCLISSTSTRIF